MIAFRHIMDRKSKPATRISRIIPFLTLVALLSSSCASTIKLEKPVQDEQQLESYFEAHGLPRCESTMPALYFSSQEWEKRALELIGSAKNYILITVFLGSWHEYSAPIYDALVKKAGEGVRIYYMLDPSSYEQYLPDRNHLVPAATKRLAEAGVHVAEYNPLTGERLFTTVGLLEREHRKFWIIDGKYLAAGGMNINYLSCAPLDKGGHLDTFVEVQSEEAARQMIRSYCTTWNAFSPERINPDDFPLCPADKPETSFWLADQGFGGYGETDTMFDAFFLYAKREVWMIQAFPFVTESLLDKIRAATSRGVTVNIMLSSHSEREIHNSAARYCMKPLIDAGAKVYLFESPEGAFLHYKLMLADRKLVAFGSANFNLRSQSLSKEMEFIFDDERIGGQAYVNLQGLLAYSRLIGQDEARSYRNLKNFTSYAIMLVGG
ncbi:MAG: phosphatidylserine/phosphatidylglycerophosphate/cardiolipin synthase family protein [Spirochaetaceae bacterium]|nr:phosphatidylserine/phosphatidylglycerophosphate/cardiolipin synthase family protein [Spirochaetaceae bacterium]